MPSPAPIRVLPPNLFPILLLSSSDRGSAIRGSLVSAMDGGRKRGRPGAANGGGVGAKRSRGEKKKPLGLSNSVCVFLAVNCFVFLAF